MVRTRFAPSPTGPVHIGNIRAAIFNWLYARHTGGAFLLRVEDTDRERSTPEAIDTLLSAMEWLGLVPDEEPLYQSGRMQAHLDAADQLLRSGHAVRENKDGKGECILFRMPKVDRAFVDRVKGSMRKPAADLSDFVIVRSNGTPVFHLANVLDDIEQGVTHVIRGDDHVENTFRHIALYEALGAPVPHFAHLPMIVNAQGKPYSKRDGDAFVGDFRENGIQADALFNYLALLGWSPRDEREVLTRAELIESFDLSGIRSSPAQMDPRKLLWMNGEYLRAMPPDEFAALCRRELESAGVHCDTEQADAIFRLMQTRLKRPAEIVDGAAFFFTEQYAIDEKAMRKRLGREGAMDLLRMGADRLASLERFDEPSIDGALRALVEEKEIGFGELMNPLRLAVSGQPSGPDLAPALALLGRQTVLQRIERTLCTRPR